MATVETVTILLTDLVGSTQLESAVGPVRADELRGEHFSILREAIADSEGAQEVKNTGDGIMVVFPSAAGAAECAVAMQQRFDVRNRGADEQLIIRIGISMGDATHEGDDYFGMPAIEAARLCDKAGSAGILVPELVKMMIGRRGEHSFKPVGGLDLKGLPEPVEAYEVLWEPIGAETGVDMPLPGRLMGTPPLSYVGRVEERELLEKMWEKAAGGERQVGLVAGEPGIGKTRLVTHAALSRHGEGANVLYGRCEEDLATPYGPWIEALSHYVEHAPDEVLKAHVDTHGGELTRLVPALRTRIPETPAPRTTDPETERYVLFSAIAGLLEMASAQRAMVLLLDDLHWADKPTLALLKHLVGGNSRQSLLMLGTYRDSELSRDHPLTVTLADLRSEEGVQRIVLKGLGEGDVVSIMEAAAGREMDTLGRRLAADIAGETDGNPFFVSELLRHLIESGRLTRREDGRWELEGEISNLGLPQSVREVVGRRIERLGESSRSALAAAAVIGRDFDVDLLLEVTGLGEDELLDLLEKAVEASILMERANRPGSFTFAHALITHTLYEDLSATRRARLAQAGGREPSRRPAVATPARGSRSWPTTGPRRPSRWTRTRRSSTAAARASARWRISRPTRRCAGSARPWSFSPSSRIRDPAERCDILIGLGEAQKQTGDSDFRQTLLDASALAEELGDGDRLARAAMTNNRGFMSAAGITDEDVISKLESAIELAGESQLERRATLLSLLSLELIWAGDLERRLELAEQALELARESGDERSVAFVLWRRFNPTALPETLDQRTADMAEMREIADRLGDPYLRFFAALYSSTEAFERGDRALLDSEVGTLREIADELGQPVPRWSARWIEAVKALLAGHLDRAEELVEEAAQVGSDSGQPDALTFYTGQLQQVRWAQDRADELEEIFVQGVEDNPDLSPYRAILAWTYCDMDRTDEARALLDPVAAGGFEEIPKEMLWLSHDGPVGRGRYGDWPPRGRRQAVRAARALV